MSCTTISPPIVPTVELIATGFCIDGSARLNLSPAFVKVESALSTKSPRVNDGKYVDISEIVRLDTSQTPSSNDMYCQFPMLGPTFVGAYVPM